jgi:oxygen-independent coproporphyrinogen-3 oxidase
MGDGRLRMAFMSSLGIYVQIPFCASKCSFCNFSSAVSRESAHAEYCQALVREVGNLPDTLPAEANHEVLFSIPVDTIYFGGGTPLIVGRERLRAIVARTRERFRAESFREFTVEVTPGSADTPALRDLLAIGVNRLSVGAQSFDDLELRAVGRLHSARDTQDLVAAARQAGFRNISLDLIAGLPHQTMNSWQRSLDLVAAIQPEHLSVYIFEVDERSRLGGEVLRHGTRFHAAAVPSEDFMADAYEAARRFLGTQGYRQYEISNFALPGKESIHNQKYWNLEPYIGLGAGAHSFDGEHRWSNWVAPSEYQARLARGDSPIEEFHTLSRKEQLEEYFFTGLRQSEGVDLSRAAREWGDEPLLRWQPAIAELTKRRLLEHQGGRLKLAESAYLLSNEVFQEFVQ